MATGLGPQHYNTNSSRQNSSHHFPSLESRQQIGALLGWLPLIAPGAIEPWAVATWNANTKPQQVTPHDLGRTGDTPLLDHISGGPGVSHLNPGDSSKSGHLLIFFLYRLCLLIIKLVWPGQLRPRRQQLCHNKVFTAEIILLDEKPGHLSSHHLPAPLCLNSLTGPGEQTENKTENNGILKSL